MNPDPTPATTDSPAGDPPAVLFIGVGNPWRGDDGVGPYIARSLRVLALPGTRAVEVSGEGAALMEAWAGAPRVVVFDAVSSGKAPGFVHRFDASAAPLPTGFFHYSTHAFSLAEAVEMARALGRLPRRLIVYGVEGRSFAAGAELTAEVRRAADGLIARCIAEAGGVPAGDLRHA
jgi:hydrogenase maturation protease